MSNLKIYKEPPKELPEDIIDKIVEHFKSFCYEREVDPDPEPAYDKAGRFAAQILAAWTPEYFKRNFYQFYELQMIDGFRFKPPRQGLIIYGAVGRGKTCLARKLFEFLREYLGKYNARFPSGSKVETSFVYDIDFYVNSNILGNDYLEDVFIGSKKKILFFDDLGNEEMAKNFGNIYGGLEILKYRHVCLERFGVPTVITTNLKPRALQEQYGVFVESRVASGYTGIFLDYPYDRRKGPPKNKG